MTLWHFDYILCIFPVSDIPRKLGVPYESYPETLLYSWQFMVRRAKFKRILANCYEVRDRAKFEREINKWQWLLPESIFSLFLW